jgi:hypothetical protein
MVYLAPYQSVVPQLAPAKYKQGEGAESWPGSAGLWLTFG